ncbi:MAG: hypothetical protein GX767_04010, partial [Firmicutes bacterium]|nr:hypothetical protein [Bacillota bacterium]
MKAGNWARRIYSFPLWKSCRGIFGIGSLMTAVTILLLLTAALYLAVPAVALAASDTLEITGKGVANPMTFTREELEKMEQHQYVYSVINTWPTKKWYVGR